MKIDAFLEIEKKYDLCNKEADDIKYWMYERFYIWNYIICADGMNLQVSQPKKKRNFIENIKVMAMVVWNIASRSFVPKQEYDVCFLNHERRVKVDGFYECAYTEKLNQIFTNSITLEQPYFTFEHFKPIKNKKLTYTDYIFMIGEINKVFHSIIKTKKYKEVYNDIKRDLDEPLQVLCKCYGIDIDKEKIYQILLHRVLRVKAEYPFYKRIIEKISPKVIVEVTHYCCQSMIVNEIAHNLGIPTIELQHGTMHTEHAAYQYAVNGKFTQLPDFVLTFSEYWNKIIHLPTESVKTIATGYPYFESQIQKYSNCNNLDDICKNIVFISQGTIGVYLAELAIDLAKLLDLDKYHIIYKLHPSEYSSWKEKYTGLQVSSIEVIDNNNLNLYELFAKCDIQVGVYSTAIYEGMGFGMQTYIYDIAHADTMQKIVEEGYAYYVKSAEELKAMIIKGEGNTQTNANVFWKKDALRNIEKIIEHCKERKV